jgi:hypothetical protein
MIASGSRDQIINGPVGSNEALAPWCSTRRSHSAPRL